MTSVHGRLLPFRQPNEVPTYAIKDTEPLVPKVVVKSVTDGGSPAVGPDLEAVELRSIYPNLEENTSLLGQALALLESAISHLREALAKRAASEFVEADDELLHVRVKLRKLFALRQLGNGFAALVNALYFCIANESDEPFEEAQLRLLLRNLTQLSRQPFPSFEEALSSIEALEEIGFQVEPSILELLVP
ncbi:MAG TPA: hypothetical protein VHQ90_21170 [Thermoanaerobaculia bacterium]|nr:hypothetical protein [Thermoanaerobaculia bacterium]